MAVPHGPALGVSGGKRKEIYKYVAPWPLYSMNWSVRPDKRFRLALGSFVEEYNNKVQIVSLDEDSSEFSAKSTFDHPYPTTKIMWIPDSKGVFADLLATSENETENYKMQKSLVLIARNAYSKYKETLKAKKQTNKSLVETKVQFEAKALKIKKLAMERKKLHQELKTKLMALDKKIAEMKN